MVLLDGPALREARVALDALSRRFLSLRPSSIEGPSLANGWAGITLAHAALEVACPRRGHAARAQRALDRAIDAIATTRLTPSLYHGFTGVAWVSEVLTRDAETIAEDDALAPIDAALEAHLSRAVRRWHDPYSLFEGLVGIGVYALERLPRTSGRRLIALIVGHLAKAARRRSPGIAWWSDPGWTPTDWRDRAHVPYRVGVAQGVAGVVGLLGRVVASDADAITKRTARSLLDGAIEWLMARERPPREPIRAGWCTGGAGIAAALFVAAYGAREASWMRFSRRVAHRAAAVSVDDSGVVDAGLCHGAAGIAHVFHRLSVELRDARLADAARAWFARTLALRGPRGFAGFRTWGVDAVGSKVKRWRTNPCFLTGAAGVTLALVAATTDAEPVWERLMLLS